MSGPAGENLTPVENKAQLVETLEVGCKPESAWRIGTEHEKFVYDLKDFKRLAYEGEPGIRQLLTAMERFGWAPVLEGGNVIALKGEDGASVSLEPGGQLELSGALLETIHQTCDEVHTHLDQVKQVCEEIGAGVVGLGFDPKWRREDISWMPKGRYKVMGRYMPTVGNLGLDMMIRTCTVQVNLDFSSERDMIAKMRAGVALQPLATALFANSPFTEGKPNGFLSYRSHVWTDTDPGRTGMIPFVFDEGFGFERWVDYLLDVPMYFVHRGGEYIDVAGKSFRDYMAGRLEGFEGQLPTMTDWMDHMTTAFPEVRLKSFIEMRGADGGPWGNLCALPAFWVGLLYDADALGEVGELIADWSVEEISRMRDDVPKHALHAPFREGTLRDVAVRVLEIARGGLKRRARISPKSGLDEQIYLDALMNVALTGKSFAEELLDAYNGRWKGNIDRVFEECKY